MAEERSGGRNRRRRYFKPKKQKDGSPSEPAGVASGKATPPAADPRSGNVRNRNKTRRRARSRQRPAEENRSQVVAEKETPYVPPKEIFVYTHSANPDLRDTYEFRPEHFSSVGRRLEDYQIDIAKLFVPDAVAGDGTPVLAKLPPPTYNWTEWEED
jgi:hypothetical protein